MASRSGRRALDPPARRSGCRARALRQLEQQGAVAHRTAEHGAPTGSGLDHDRAGGRGPRLVFAGRARRQTPGCGSSRRRRWRERPDDPRPRPRPHRRRPPALLHVPTDCASGRTASTPWCGLANSGVVVNLAKSSARRRGGAARRRSRGRATASRKNPQPFVVTVPFSDTPRSLQRERNAEQRRRGGQARRWRSALGRVRWLLRGLARCRSGVHARRIRRAAPSTRRSPPQRLEAHAPRRSSSASAVASAVRTPGGASPRAVAPAGGHDSGRGGAMKTAGTVNIRPQPLEGHVGLAAAFDRTPVCRP